MREYDFKVIKKLAEDEAWRPSITGKRLYIAPEARLNMSHKFKIYKYR